jgi:hypothetical protein
MRAGVLVMLGVTALALAPAAAARPPLPDRPEDGSSRSCNAGTLTIRDGKPLKLVVFDQTSAIARARGATAARPSTPARARAPRRPSGS